MLLRHHHLQVHYEWSTLSVFCVLHVNNEGQILERQLEKTTWRAEPSVISIQLKIEPLSVLQIKL